MRYLSSTATARGLLAVLGAACGGAPPEPGTFVGALAGSESVLGLTTTDARGKAYLCGGETTMDTHHAWFAFDIARRIEASGYDASLSLAADGDGWTGTVTDPDGASFDVELRRGTEPEGPFSTEEESGCAAGAVVIDDGDGPRMQGVVCFVGVIPAQVVPVGQINPGPIQVQSATDPPVAFVVSPAIP